MDKQSFLAEYNISEADLLEADISWEELVLIEGEYRKLEKNFSPRIRVTSCIF